MRLKSLELVGFKSFLEPTTISFSPGMTAVVGPNGCGKSNVMDAIRWVLGEQAPTRLRGKSTEDLIFAGNDSNPPAGMAEVALVLEAQEGSALPEPYAALSEVAVTRRVYRSGESEYLLNRIPCRLKDITEFFMAAQIHSRGYALIEQGRIEEIIQAKPSELRALVEEAAGLSLFKGRREMSERKLERVKEALGRIDDVLSEIERQLAFARRQAKKAEAYKLIRVELDELERLCAARRLFEQRAELEFHCAQATELKAAADRARAAVAAAQAEMDAAAAALLTSRERLGAESHELEGLEAQSAERERASAFLKRRLSALDQLEPELSGRLAEREEQATAARAARAATGARAARELNTRNEVQERFKQAAASDQRAQAALKEANRNAEELKDEVAELVREAAVIRGRLGDLAGERAELEERCRTAGEAMPAAVAALQEARDAVERAQADLARAQAEFARLESSEREAADREMEARTAAESLGARIAAMRQMLAPRAALEASRTAARAGEAAGARLRTVLESLNGDRPAVEPAMLRQAIRAPGELEPLLDAVLGDSLEAVIVESPHFALRAIEILKEKNGGRLSFVPEPEQAFVHAPIDAPGIAGRLIDMVEVDARFRPAVEVMIGHVVVAEDLRCALAASNLNGHGTLFVTREGDLVWPGRMIAGGSVSHDHGQSDRDGAAAASSEELRAALTRAEGEHRGLAEGLETARAGHGVARDALKQARSTVAAAEREALARRAGDAATEQKLSLAQARGDDDGRRMAEIGQSAAGLNARLQELAGLEQDARARLGALAQELDRKRSAAAQSAADALAAGERVSAHRGGLETLDQELRHLAARVEEIDGQITHDRAALERAGVERAEFHEEMANLAAQESGARDRAAVLREAVATLAARCEQEGGAVEVRRETLSSTRAGLASAENDDLQCALKTEHARTLIEELLRSFNEKFQADFEAESSDLRQALAGRATDRDETRLGELRAKAERIGEVNLAAESEVKELEERAQALDVERADLRKALADLTQTIHRLNREARRRFAETFEGAARNFAELFPKLMRGGKARLELMAADDVLEAGVNILVQPPGKKVKEIALLSGGEKALSAMALVFSLFLLNPSPFCVMDEVDAPLDEFSLAAFTSLLGELKERSQFIVVTHNQRTMQRADHIHGVTMERPGISRIISLRIPQAA